MHKLNKVLLAGATGYLGKYVAQELIKQSFPIRLLARSPKKLDDLRSDTSEIVRAEVTLPENLTGVMRGIDTVISTVGITKQKDGLSYMDVDFQANMNLLKEAKASGVRKFIYVSVLDGQKMRHLKICEAKEAFVDALQASGMDYAIIRPNGFFNDMSSFLDMARMGRVYVFGDGLIRANPIHGADLAKVCVDAIDSSREDIEVGGPEILTQEDIALLAFRALGKKPKIINVPDVLRKISLFLARTFTSSKTYGPIEFFLTALAREMVAPQVGHRSLESYFEHEALRAPSNEHQISVAQSASISA